MTNLHCIILGGQSLPHRYFPNQESALRAAVSRAKRTHKAIAVAWCNRPGNPKLWLAGVDANGIVRKTAHWEASR